MQCTLLGELFQCTSLGGRGCLELATASIAANMPKRQQGPRDEGRKNNFHIEKKLSPAKTRMMQLKVGRYLLSNFSFYIGTCLSYCLIYVVT